MTTISVLSTANDVIQALQQMGLEYTLVKEGPLITIDYDPVKSTFDHLDDALPALIAIRNNRVIL